MGRDPLNGAEWKRQLTRGEIAPQRRLSGIATLNQCALCAHAPRTRARRILEGPNGYMFTQGETVLPGEHRD